MTQESRSKHVIELAKELLDDIELNRVGAEQLLLKATRLARWMGSEEIQQWLRLEMTGYDSSEVSLKYMSITGRWTDYEKKLGYWGPLAQQEATIQAQKAKLASMRTPDSSGDYANIAITKCHNRYECNREQYLDNQRHKKQGICAIASIRERSILQLSV